MNGRIFATLTSSSVFVPVKDGATIFSLSQSMMGRTASLRLVSCGSISGFRRASCACHIRSRSPCLSLSRREAMTGFWDASATRTTIPSPYAGAIFNAVWSSDVAAPPTNIGVLIPASRKVVATLTISPSDGDMSPLSPMKSG